MSVPAAGRAVALDPGTQRIGVAVSDRRRTMAFPRPPVLAGPDAIAACAAIAEAEEAAVVVIGLPLGLDGTEGAAARAARELAAGLADQLGPRRAVVLHDERLTTVTASTRLREAGRPARAARSRVDGAAAVVLLESWMASA